MPDREHSIRALALFDEELASSVRAAEPRRAVARWLLEAALRRL